MRLLLLRLLRRLLIGLLRLRLRLLHMLRIPLRILLRILWEMGISLICRIRRVCWVPSRHSPIRILGSIRRLIRAAEFAPVHTAEKKTNVYADAEEELADRLDGLQVLWRKPDGRK